MCSLRTLSHTRRYTHNMPRFHPKESYAMTNAMQKHILSRPMQGEGDFQRMRQLLIETVPITPVGFNWDIRRLEGKRYYSADPAANPLLSRPTQLWENSAGELVAFVLAESDDDAHLQVHPDYRFLEDELVAWAEEQLGAADELGNRAAASSNTDTSGS